MMNYWHTPPEVMHTATTPVTPPGLMRFWEGDHEIGSVSYYLDEVYAEWRDTAAVYPTEIERFTVPIIDDGPIFMCGLPGEFADEE